MTNFINEKAALDYVQQSIRETLEKHVGTTDLEAVKKSLIDQLSNLENQEVINTFDNKVKVSQLWKTWSFRQKLKWLTYNKLPFVKDLSKQTRNIIDKHNAMVCELQEDKDFAPPLEYMEYPEHLVPDPKMVCVTDVKMKLNTGINFIQLEMNISGETKYD